MLLGPKTCSSNSKVDLHYLCLEEEQREEEDLVLERPCDLGKAYLEADLCLGGSVG